MSKHKRTTFLICCLWSLVHLASAVGWERPPLARLIADLESGDAQKRDEALDHLRHAGADYVEAVPALVAVLDDSDLRRGGLAMESLGNMRSSAKAAVPRLTALLQHESASTRLRAAETLWAIARPAEILVPVLTTEMRKGNDPDRRDQAARLLCRMGPAARLAAPEMVALLASSEPDDREHGARVLEAIAPAARDTMATALRSALLDKTSVVRVLAAEALWKLDAAPNDLLPVLVEVLREKPRKLDRERVSQVMDVPPARQAARVLGQMGPDAKAAVPALIEALEVPHFGLQEEAAEALGRIGPEAREAAEALAKMVVHGDGFATSFHTSVSLPETAATALLRIGPESIPALVGVLREGSGKYQAVRALAGFSSQAPQLIAPLAPLLDDDNEQVRARTALALARFGQAARPATARIVARLNDQEKCWDDIEMGDFRGDVVGDCMAEALIKMDADPTTVVPAVIELIEKSGTLSDAMVRVLRRLGPRAKAAIPALERLLEQPNSRIAAARALARIDPDHPRVLAVFRNALRGPEGYFDLQVVRGLGDLGPRAKELSPQLAKAGTPDGLDLPGSHHAIAAAAWLQVSPESEEAMRSLAQSLQFRDAWGTVQGYDEAEAVFRNLARKDVVRPILLAGLRHVEAGRSPRDSKRRQSEIRRRNAELLWWIDPAAVEPVATLAEICRDVPPEQDWDHPREPAYAADLMARLGPPPHAALDALVKTISHHGWYLHGGDMWGHGSTEHIVGDRAVPALARLGAAAVPPLRELLHHSDPPTRRRAAECLASIGPSAGPATDDLLAALQTGDATLRAAAAHALGVIGAERPRVIGPLVAALKDSRLSVRIAAAEALGRLGASARAAVPALRSLLSEPFDTSRAAAAKSLGEIGE